MTLNLLLLYFVWTEEYCQTSPNENKSPNLWNVTSILVWSIFAAGPAYIIPKDYINCLYQMAMKSSSKLYMEDIFITGILRDKCNIELKFVLQILSKRWRHFPPKKDFLQSLWKCKNCPLSRKARIPFFHCLCNL